MRSCQQWNFFSPLDRGGLQCDLSAVQNQGLLEMIPFFAISAFNMYSSLLEIRSIERGKRGVQSDRSSGVCYYLTMCGDEH